MVYYTTSLKIFYFRLNESIVNLNSFFGDNPVCSYSQLFILHSLGYILIYTTFGHPGRSKQFNTLFIKILIYKITELNK